MSVVWSEPLSDGACCVQVVDDLNRGTYRQRRLRATEVPGNELTDQLRALPFANDRTEVVPVIRRNADRACSRVGLLRSHPPSVARVRTRSPERALPCTYTSDRVVYVHESAKSPFSCSPSRLQTPQYGTIKGHHFMAVSKRLRYEILRRDNHACRYCGATAPGAKLAVDHVIPQSLGGSDKPSNLVASCADCNGGKTSSMPNAMPVADVDQETFRRAAELKQTHAEPEASAATVRAAFHAHLIAVWQWAWDKGAHTEPTQEQERKAFEELALLADGSDLPSDYLTEVAFRAGSARSTNIAHFLSPQLSTEQFSLGADAVTRWSERWEAASGGAGPSMDQLAEFCSILHALVSLVDASTQQNTVMHASERAGEQMDTQLLHYLAAPATQEN